MKKITITVKDETKSPLLIALLDALDFIQYKEEPEFVDHKAFEESFGMWKDAEINVERLRAKAWKRTA